MLATKERARHVRRQCEREGNREATEGARGSERVRNVNITKMPSQRRLHHRRVAKKRTESYGTVNQEAYSRLVLCIIRDE